VHRYCYRLYGLNTVSEVLLPGLPPGGEPVDVTVEYGRVELRDVLDCPVFLEEGRLSFGQGRAFIQKEGVGRFLVEGGRRIVVDPCPEGDEQLLPDHLLGPTFVFLLHMRGMVVFHASAAEVGGGVVAFLGRSGRGKSTTAKALHDAGHSLVTDDVLVLDVRTEPPRVFPGPAQVKLWPKGAGPLENGNPLVPELPPGGKHIVPLRGLPPQACPPLRCLYLIEEGSEIAVEDVPPREASLELVRHSYAGAMRWLDVTGAQGANLRECVRLAMRVPVRRFFRPRSLEGLPEVVARIEREARALSGSRETAGAALD
jgi:hypothetical protein